MVTRASDERGDRRFGEHRDCRGVTEGEFNFMPGGSSPTLIMTINARREIQCRTWDWIATEAVNPIVDCRTSSTDHWRNLSRPQASSTPHRSASSQATGHSGQAATPRSVGPGLCDF